MNDENNVYSATDSSGFPSTIVNYDLYGTTV